MPDGAPAPIQEMLQGASAAAQQGRYADCEQICRDVLSREPSNLPALGLLGISQLHLGRNDEAIYTFTRLKAMRPGVAQPTFHLATALQKTGDHAAALKEFRDGLQLEPRNVRARDAMIQSLLATKRFEEVVAECEARLAIEPDGNSHLSLYTAFNELGRFKERDEHLSTALRTAPNSFMAHLLMGQRQMVEGDFEAARESLNRSVELQPKQGGGYLGLVQIGAITEAEGPMFDRMLSVAAEGSIPLDGRYQLNFAIAKLYEDAGDFERSMRFYDEGNRLASEIQKASPPFDPRDLTSANEVIERIFTPQFIESNRGGGDPSEVPIFVIGMIRSGTSLLEQILASHPDVAGAGEHMYWNKVVTENPDAVAMFRDRSRVAETTREYCRLLSTFGPGKQRIINKLPTNYLLAGLIHLHLPNARIIHVRRSPIDTCLSIWTTRFTSIPRAAGNRANIVFAYKQYLRTMEHWRSVLPADRLMEIDYETLVSDRENVVRSMVDFCGLPWSDSCLHHEENLRPVMTPSLVRVRKPIDSTRVARWKRFEPWLGDFRELLQFEK